MITRYRLATPLQITALTVAWLGFLLLIDYTKNPHLWTKAPPPRPASAPLSLYVNHLCCTGCLADVQAGLKTLPWIEPDKVRARKDKVLTTVEAEAMGPAGEYGGWVDVQVKDPARIDFVAVDRALRDKGLVASRMEFGGPPHFRLEAQVAHMCCGICEDAARRTTELTRAVAAARLLWVDSVTADHAKHLIVVHARYLKPGNTVDVAELLAALDQIGLAPYALRVETGPEKTTPDGSAAEGGGL
jgi:hypothetical protein